MSSLAGQVQRLVLKRDEASVNICVRSLTSCASANRSSSSRCASTASSSACSFAASAASEAEVFDEDWATREQQAKDEC